MRFQHVAAYLGLALVPVTFAEEKPCKTHDKQGNFYDINPLNAKKDYSFKSPGGNEFYLNVCKSMVQDSWNAKVPNPEKIAGVVRRAHGDIVIGEVNTTLTIHNGNPRLYLVNGSPCPNSSSNLKASTVIDFICQKGEVVSNTPRLSAQLPPDDDTACAFVVEWPTRFACPTSENGPLGLFASFLVTIVVLLMTYLVLGTLYNRFVLGLSGFDQIPQFSIDSAKYHLRNGFDYARDFIQSQHAPPSESGVFSRVRPQTNPFSHQATVAAAIRPVQPPRPTQSEPMSPPRAPKKTADIEKGLGPSKPEEREFMLGDDGEEDAGPSSSTNLPAKGMGSDGVIRL